MTDHTCDLALALTLADTADRITLDRAGAADLRVEAKPDRTPVTDADLAVEDAIRAVLRVHRPRDAVVGEERGGPSGDAGRAWLLDPIDGTKNFLRGVPVWATLIALVEDGDADGGGDQRAGAAAPLVGSYGGGCPYPRPRRDQPGHHGLRGR